MRDLGVASWCLDRQPLNAYQLAAKLGFSALHLGVSNPEDASAMTLKRSKNTIVTAMEKTAVKTNCIALNIVESMGMLEKRGGKVEACREIFSKALSFSTEASIPMIYFPSFGLSEIKSLEDLQDTIRFLQNACDRAGEKDVLIASENSLNAVQNKLLIKGVNRENFRVLLDTYNPLRWGHSTLELIDEIYDSIAPQIHIKDGIDGGYGNTSVGMGDGEVRQILTRLREKSFSGSYVLETNYLEFQELDPVADISALNAMLSEPLRPLTPSDALQFQ